MMISDQSITYLRYIHGAFNFTMMLLFLFQGSLGRRIRRGRLAGSPEPNAIRKHRRLGPVLMPLGVCGFLAGVLLVILDKGHVYEYPLHFLTGLAITTLLISTYLISRRIKGPATPWRNTHLTLGIMILCLYPFQAFLGLGILL